MKKQQIEKSKLLSHCASMINIWIPVTRGSIFELLIFINNYRYGGRRMNEIKYLQQIESIAVPVPQGINDIETMRTELKQYTDVLLYRTLCQSL